MMMIWNDEHAPVIAMRQTVAIFVWEASLIGVLEVKLRAAQGGRSPRERRESEREVGISDVLTPWFSPTTGPLGFEKGCSWRIAVDRWQPQLRRDAKDSGHEGDMASARLGAQKSRPRSRCEFGGLHDAIESLDRGADTLSIVTSPALANPFASRTSRWPHRSYE
jgi:hypothetical protein